MDGLISKRSGFTDYLYFFECVIGLLRLLLNFLKQVVNAVFDAVASESVFDVKIIAAGHLQVKSPTAMADNAL